MRAFKSNLYLFTALIIIVSILQGCGTQQKSDSISDDNDTTFGKPVAYGSIKIDPGIVKTEVDQLIQKYDCLNKCDECLYKRCEPADVICDPICSKFRSIVTPDDSADRPSGEVVNEDILKVGLDLTKEANALEYKVAQYNAISKKTTTKFKLMEADLGKLIVDLDYLYKQKLSAIIINKKPNYLKSTN